MTADPHARDYPLRPILCASAAVWRDGKVLLGARRMPPFDTMFSLPGGLVETGETLEEAAVREVEEETGVRAAIVAFNGWREVIARDDDNKVKRHYVIASFAARWLEGEGEAGEELSEVIWADPQRYGAMHLTDGLADLLASSQKLVLQP